MSQEILFPLLWANKKTTKTEFRKEKLNFLKGLTNRFIRTGDILHLAIRTYLNNLNKATGFSNNSLIEWATNIFKDDRKYSSKTEVERSALSYKYSPSLLLEYYYKQEDVENKCDESSEKLRLALNNFLSNPELIRFHRGATDTDAIIEKPIRVKNGSFCARGKVDLSYKSNGRIVIVDWKLGSESTSDESLQLAFYGLWAVQEYQCQPECVELYKVYLNSNEIVQLPFSSRSVIRAKARILQDLEKMQLIDRYGKDANYKAFTSYLQSKVCSLCPFQGICFEGITS